MFTPEQAKEMGKRSGLSRLRPELKYARENADKLRADLKTMNKPEIAAKYKISIRDVYRILNGK